MRGVLCLTTVLIIAVQGNALAFISMPQRPHLPIGWEERMARGFEPAIELALESEYHPYETGMPIPRMQEHMNRWGERAVPVLLGFLKDRRWEPFHKTIIAYLGASESKEAAAWGNKQIMEILGKEEWRRVETKRLSLLGNAFGTTLAPATITRAKTRLIQLASEPYSRGKWLNGATELFEMLRIAGPEDLADLLERHATEGPECLRETCINRLVYLQSERAYAAAVALADETRDQELRRRVVESIAKVSAPVRAQEPMSQILRMETEQD